ncbi:CDGSH iron-sulfur domain-containing protein [Legionella bononiensis]|uniref:CDGSH iron-sulfur domain-containing protein n=1 Tax=Legionella bononiensis TaxID=2793102 RepID=A0ABS1W7V3_9GAMM|nr:CDGSH iron-sulfur domain-containing protein [Legionella bononiensis]MBL7480047.1 CDGSH iron-sulfur domain-containing protein [Legionella bononiensis]MBL7525439.1 CDGSH iron-sulfur domain-containing protein [Legionella bononiensis]MBL7561622.1 CDGSH iron-sulfur domain-containing protein [Legionella bononiensis]
MDDSKYKDLFPIAVEVQQGQEYYWCSCGESTKPPFCDKDDCGQKSIYYLADLTEDLHFCNCKQTKNPPLCDGSHAKLLLEIVNKRQNT